MLFWLSLFPFVTNWAGDTHFASIPVALYGVVLLCCAIAWDIMARLLARQHGRESLLAAALGRHWKETSSLILYATGIILAFASPIASMCIYTLVAAIWFIPDRRIEKRMADQ